MPASAAPDTALDDAAASDDNAPYRAKIIEAATAVHDALQLAYQAVHGARGLASATFSWEGSHPLADFANWVRAYGNPQGEAASSGPSQAVQQLNKLYDDVHDWMEESQQSFDDESMAAWLGEANGLISRAKQLAVSISANFANAGAFSKWLAWAAGELESPDDPSADDPANNPPGMPSLPKVEDEIGKVMQGILLLAALFGIGWVSFTFGPAIAAAVKRLLGGRTANPRRRRLPAKRRRARV